MNFKRLRLISIHFTMMLCLLQAGCGYGKVSPRATEYAKAIYTATNLQKGEKIEAIRNMIDKDLEQGSIPQRDADYLLAILNQAEAGKWEQAMQASRELMKDQI